MSFLLYYNIRSCQTGIRIRSLNTGIVSGCPCTNQETTLNDAVNGGLSVLRGLRHSVGTFPTHHLVHNLAYYRRFRQARPSNEYLSGEPCVTLFSRDADFEVRPSRRVMYQFLRIPISLCTWVPTTEIYIPVPGIQVSDPYPRISKRKPLLS